VAAIVLAIALLVATVGALGVAAVGWLLHRWFDLSQWQGTVIAFGVALSLGFLIYKMAALPTMATREEEDLEDWEEEEEEPEPPIVPWRRSRPTPGELPPQKPAGGASKPTGKRK
jgi:hypothetical protein